MPTKRVCTPLQSFEASQGPTDSRATNGPATGETRGTAAILACLLALGWMLGQAMQAFPKLVPCSTALCCGIVHHAAGEDGHSPPAKLRRAQLSGQAAAQRQQPALSLHDSELELPLELMERITRLLPDVTDRRGGLSGIDCCQMLTPWLLLPFHTVVGLHLRDLAKHWQYKAGLINA